MAEIKAFFILFLNISRQHCTFGIRSCRIKISKIKFEHLDTHIRVHLQGLHKMVQISSPEQTKSCSVFCHRAFPLRNNPHRICLSTYAQQVRRKPQSGLYSFSLHASSQRLGPSGQQSGLHLRYPSFTSNQNASII